MAPCPWGGVQLPDRVWVPGPGRHPPGPIWWLWCCRPCFCWGSPASLPCGATLWRTWCCCGGCSGSAATTAAWCPRPTSSSAQLRRMSGTPPRWPRWGCGLGRRDAVHRASVIAAINSIVGGVGLALLAAKVASLATGAALAVGIAAAVALFGCTCCTSSSEPRPWSCGQRPRQHRPSGGSRRPR